MITVFNRAKLITDSNAEYIATIWSTLKKNGIPYEMKTLKNKSTFSRNLHYNQGISHYHGGMAGSNFADNMVYVYVIYVEKKNLARAKEVTGL